MRTKMILAAVAATMMLSPLGAGADPFAGAHVLYGHGFEAVGELDGEPGSFVGMFAADLPGAVVTTADGPEAVPTRIAGMGVCDGDSACDFFTSAPTYAVNIDPTLSLATLTMTGTSHCGGDLIASAVLTSNAPVVHDLEEAVDSSGVTPFADVSFEFLAAAFRWGTFAGGSIESPCLGSHTIAGGGDAYMFRGLIAEALVIND